MRRIICALFILSLTGCMFIVREYDDVKKTVGISKEKAQEEVVALDSITTKDLVYPFVEAGR